MKSNQRAAFFIGSLSHYLYIVQGTPFGVFLYKMLAFSEHIHFQMIRKCVDTRNPHTVQTARHLVSALVELTTGMQYGHNHFQSAFLFFGVHIGRDTATVVAHRNGIVFVYGYLHMGAISSQSLIDGVIDHFIYQMVKTTHVYVAYIHGRALTHGLQAFQYLNILGGVVGPFLLLFF